MKEIATTNRILEVRVGSHLHGTDTEDSDEDFIGIFMPEDKHIYGMSNKEDEASFDIKSKDEIGRNTKDAIDRKYHEYRRFCRLALQNNPNVLTVLFANEENTIFLNNYGQRLLDMRLRFPHKGGYHRYQGYAFSQRKKMVLKPEKYSLLKGALEYLESKDPNEVMATILKEDLPFFKQRGIKHIFCGDINLETSWFIKKAKKVIKQRLDSATNRKKVFEEFGYDVIFGTNLIKLQMQLHELLMTGQILFPMKHRETLLDIKRGVWKMDEVLSFSEELDKDCEAAFKVTKLPTKPRFEEIQNFVISEMKRYVEQRDFDTSIKHKFF